MTITSSSVHVKEALIRKHSVVFCGVYLQLSPRINRLSPKWMMMSREASSSLVEIWLDWWVSVQSI